MLVALIVIASPLSSLDRQLLTFHMVQHLSLMTIAAPLLLSALPLPSRPHWLLHPVTCWLAGTMVVLVWHVPALHQIAMGSPSCHLVQQLSFLAGGLLFWHPVLARPADPRMPVYLFLATLPCDALSAFLAFCGRTVYACHLAGPTLLPLSPLEDQQCAGALMWFWVTIAYVLPAVAVILRLLSPRPELA